MPGFYVGEMSVLGISYPLLRGSPPSGHPVPGPLRRRIPARGMPPPPWNLIFKPGSVLQTGLITGVLIRPIFFGNPKNCRIRAMTLLSSGETPVSAPEFCRFTTKRTSGANRTDCSWQTRLLSGNTQACRRVGTGGPDRFSGHSRENTGKEPARMVGEPAGDEPPMRIREPINIQR